MEQRDQCVSYHGAPHGSNHPEPHARVPLLVRRRRRLRRRRCGRPLALLAAVARGGHAGGGQQLLQPHQGCYCCWAELQGYHLLPAPAQVKIQARRVHGADGRPGPDTPHRVGRQLLPGAQGPRAVGIDDSDDARAVGSLVCRGA